MGDCHAVTYGMGNALGSAYVGRLPPTRHSSLLVDAGVPAYALRRL